MCYISFHFVWYAHQSQALKVFCHEVFYKHSTILPLLKVFLYIVFVKVLKVQGRELRKASQT